MTAQQVVYLVLFSAMFAVWLGVVLTYHIMSGGRWRRTPEGRHVMLIGVVFVWVSALTLANLLFGHYPGRFVIGVTSYSLFVIMGAQRLAMIIGAQRRKARQIQDAITAIRQPHRDRVDD